MRLPGELLCAAVDRSAARSMAATLLIKLMESVVESVKTPAHEQVDKDECYQLKLIRANKAERKRMYDETFKDEIEMAKEKETERTVTKVLRALHRKLDEKEKEKEKPTRKSGRALNSRGDTESEDVDVTGEESHGAEEEVEICVEPEEELSKDLASVDEAETGSEIPAEIPKKKFECQVCEYR
jgi:hypothetical protein